METVMPLPASPNAVELLRDLAAACKRAGLLAEIREQSVRMHVQHPALGGSHLAETITLMPDAENDLCAWWSWGKRIGSMTDIPTIVRSVVYVVTPEDS